MDNDTHWVARVWTTSARVTQLGLLALLWSICLSADEATAQNASEATHYSTAKETLRVIKFKNYAASNEHRDVAVEMQMLTDFAETHHLKIEWVDVYRSTEALQKLNNGDADLSIGALPVGHTDDLIASEPIALQRYRIIGRNDEVAQSPAELAGMSLAVKLSSPMWSYLDRLRVVVDDLRLQVLPGDLSREDTLQMVSDGIYDAALLATEVDDRTIVDHPRLKYLFDLSGSEPVTWIARPANQHLIDNLDKFIRRFHIAYHNPNRAARTFADIKKHGVLRVITRLDENNYFLNRGRPAGFELGFARRFADKYGLRLDVLVGQNDAEILGWLRDGAGDIVTARINSQLVHGEPTYSMSREYRHDASVIITSSRKPIRRKIDLTNKIVASYEGSSTFVALENFIGNIGTALRVDTQVSMALLLERIEAGVIDAAVIDAHHVDTVLKTHDGLAAGMSIQNPYRYRWTLRGADAPLIAAVDQFIQAEYRDEVYNVLERRYAHTTKLQQRELDDISPFDDLLQIYAEKYSFDWRLIAAQMYQESHFDPAAVSDAGAIGLMQIMPTTSIFLGVENPHDPEAGIHAGIRYLDYLRNRFDNLIPMSERTWLALAAYNIGYDRIRRARNLAQELGLNPNKWFGNVEVAMRRMTQLFANSCRCGETIVYVRSIRSLYYAYRNLKLADRTHNQRHNRQRPLALSVSARAPTG